MTEQYTHAAYVTLFYWKSTFGTHYTHRHSLVLARRRAVLTNGHSGHVPRAPDFSFLFEGPLTGCGEINSLKLIILLLMLLHDRTNTSSAYLVNLQITVQ